MTLERSMLKPDGLPPHQGKVTSTGAVLPTLPAGWVWKSLDEIAEVKLGKMLSRSAYAEGLHQRPYLRNANVRWGVIDLSNVKMMGFKETEFQRYSLDHGDLLICEGGEVGRCAVFNGQSGQYMYQKALHRVRPLHGVLDSSFLQYFFWHHVHAGTIIPRPSETTIQHLPLEEVSVLPISLPPAAEQRRIVAEIEKHFTRLDAAVAALKRAQANLKRYRAAVLKAACEGRLVPTEAELARAEGRDYEPADKLLARILQERRAKGEADQVAKASATGKSSAKSTLKTRYQEATSLNLAELPLLPTTATTDTRVNFRG